MTTLKELQRKYSGNPIPQWELDKLNEAPIEQPKQRKQRTKKDLVSNGNLNPDLH